MLLIARRYCITYLYPRFNFTKTMKHESVVSSMKTIDKRVDGNDIICKETVGEPNRRTKKIIKKEKVKGQRRLKGSKLSGQKNETKSQKEKRKMGRK